MWRRRLCRVGRRPLLARSRGPGDRLPRSRSGVLRDRHDREVGLQGPLARPAVTHVRASVRLTPGAINRSASSFDPHDDLSQRVDDPGEADGQVPQLRSSCSSCASTTQPDRRAPTSKTISSPSNWEGPRRTRRTSGPTGCTGARGRLDRAPTESAGLLRGHQTGDRAQSDSETEARERLSPASRRPIGGVEPRWSCFLAAGVGFEPTDELPRQRFSRPPRSAAPAPRRGHLAEVVAALLRDARGRAVALQHLRHSPRKFSRIASAQRSVTAVPFSVCGVSSASRRRGSGSPSGAPGSPSCSSTT